MGGYDLSVYFMAHSVMFLIIANVHNPKEKLRQCGCKDEASVIYDFD